MMNRRNLLVGVALVGVGALVTGRVIAGKDHEHGKDCKGHEHKEASHAEGAPDMEAMMAEYMKNFGAPAAEHKEMAKCLGKWDVVCKSWHGGPDGEPMVSTATAVFKPVLDGHYFIQNYKCNDFMGQPYYGLGMQGYDRFTKQYFSTWMDSWSTGMMVMYGQADASGTITYHGKMDDPMTGRRDSPIRAVARDLSDDAMVFEMHDKAPDGTEYKMMELTYTRKK
jgi:hypothetical protein